MIKKLSASIALVLSCTVGFVPFTEAAELQSARLSGKQLVLNTDEHKVVLSAIGDGAVSVHYQVDGMKQLPSFALAENAEYSIGELVKTQKGYQYKLDDLNVVIQKSPFKLSYFHGGKEILSEEEGFVSKESSEKHHMRGFRFELSKDEKLIGGGQRVLGMDRRGQRMPLYNKASYGYTTHAEQMYYGLPAVMSNKKYALVFDNSANGWMDLGKTESDIMQFEAVGGRTAYIVAAGESYQELIENLTAATGRQPLPPRWALGNFASRFGYKTQQQTEDTVNAFIEQDIPLDAVVLDLFWFGKEMKGTMGNLAWEKDSFPTPEKMIADFKKKGVNTILITEPFILSTSNRWVEANNADALAKGLDGKVKTFDFYFGNTGLVDVFSNKGQDWFWSKYQPLLNQGVAGWWGDLGEPEVHPSDTLHTIDAMNGAPQATADEIHNVYGHQWAKNLFEKLNQAQPNQRPMIMMRSGFVGSQRYGMIPWTGDVSRSWGGLKPQVELGLQMGLLGLGYTHSDLGGFAGGEKFDAELYTRWLQYGAFQPVYRPHAQDNIAPEPVFHDEKTKDIVRKFIKLRYALLPYNYTLAYENSMTGMPLMRPMMFANDTSKAFDNASSYFWGDAFLVTPVVDPNVKSVDIDLPNGVWIDFFDESVYQGGKSIKLATRKDTLPVLVKAGSFVPMVEPVQSTKDYSTRVLNLHYYHDESVSHSTGQMFEDDGVNPNSITTQEYELGKFEAKFSKDKLKITLKRELNKSKNWLKARVARINIHNVSKAPKRVLYNGIEGVFRFKKDRKTLTLLSTWEDESQVDIIW
ncbi:glycosyl hydrolase [Parashewanella spongiae]|uniref:Glycosyl hydrolase n=1 Tax=Parashewanella spongiae TaxID=342950 RepID=A0A3A6UNK0_9GAMM|nr:TIM-barrel domain-containing protein [Parashewanella spongiae]MCL1078698.1 glycosyl hydrolase [Parashewanella spongiae]RJY19393.1 glycosyl hydrolase [Parashewanella spongiae]